MRHEININNHIEIFDTDKVAKQAAGAVLMQEKNAVVLATVAREEKMVEEDFLPLTVQYIEKAYAAGKIPGGYVKRETKPGDSETLSARIIDRSLRPLFPKGYAYPTQIVIMVLSADPEVDLQVMSLNAASVALYLSDIPIKAPVCGVRIGRINNEFVLNPSNNELKNSTLDLYVAGVKDELLMIEMRALSNKKDNQHCMNELSEDDTLKALDFASSAILRGSNEYEKAFAAYRKNSKLEFKIESDNIQIIDYIKNTYITKLKIAINQMAKSERASEILQIAKEIESESMAIENEWKFEDIEKALHVCKRELVRNQIINENKRADGRGLKDVRKIDIETNILPSAHGSCLFTRGQTQALVVATLGNDNDAQMSDMLTEKNPICEKFMVNYNFPGFSVGEASPIKAPGRRELGHGNLAKRALYPSVDADYIHTIRLVSEILESNGSSSMATVCGGALALRAAGVKSEKLVAGVAMGLVFEEEKYAILTDIMGLEDHDGDMDFKVAGSHDGITALQMDIKLGGIEQKVLQEALYQAKEARGYILNLMQEACEKIIVNEAILPKVEIFNVDPNKIPDIIGQGGKTIKDIIEKFEVNIDLDRDKGEVKIAGIDHNLISQSKEYILNLLHSKGSNKRRDKKEMPKFDIGEEFLGRVQKVVEFGVFVELKEGVDGLLHNSKIKEKLEVGHEIKVKVAEIKNGKVSLDLA
ncbi:polyribonucleotide nucleotidyltransferase [Campylobacter lari]|uniref:polyribonucleotide nucleotidyltransferase n=1 Tax=Campylobacter lari TaxID=201 RepID=UPI0008B2CDD8|nr:polyribonucleotide nucleotidyltransferase [Campylobacter lari]EAJ0334385.1 polyribonucleotide nucleotidyltransferase [Campylobacter lari]EHJ5165753.1 polyribonucleotide nucleotidyltransferase [Campylobacter lari]MCW0196393.1 polyribonucleotide nucleotidyltransferase [Campylobacter lari]MCW0230203.1 polyribonucleotide nucleotidyltransferase [Campylobacter lari]MCW0238116.1 polyribonucleotide nucleotidyltransferase [Campylobacter lari]